MGIEEGIRVSTTTGNCIEAPIESGKTPARAAFKQTEDAVLLASMEPALLHESFNLSASSMS